MNHVYVLSLTICATLIFLVAGVNHALTLTSSTNFLQTYVPFSYFPRGLNTLIELVATFIEIVAPLVMVLAIANKKYRQFGKWAAYGLAFLLVCIMLLIHNPFFKGERMNFLKTLALLSAVLFAETHM
jgi:uncharacterized membrane protein YhaH (DUF805 family)